MKTNATIENQELKSLDFFIYQDAPSWMMHIVISYYENLEQNFQKKNKDKYNDWTHELVR